MSALQTSATAAAFHEAAQVFRPPPKLTVLEWAERERMLSSESSSMVGHYRSDVAPYQRGMHNAVNIPGVEEVVFFTAAQMGKSLTEENIFGYFCDRDPCSMIWMWPTDLVAKAWSLDTLDPLLQDTTALAEKFSRGSRKAASATLFKKFPGGWLAVIGANAPAGLRRRRARLVIADEIDGYPESAGEEGDPIGLVGSRQETFWDRLLILASTCTLKNESRIEARYLISNQQRYYVPCKDCGEFQLLAWKRLVYPKDAPPTRDNTHYACEFCGSAHDELDKMQLLRRGEWRAARPEITKVQGFWISKMYSPFLSWAQMVERYIKASAQLPDNKQPLKVFVNLDLAETWEERDELVDREGLVKRCEDYHNAAIVQVDDAGTPAGIAAAGPLPDGIVLLTAGCDVQPDRIELELVGWGRGEESWSCDWRVFEGDTARPEVWAQLDRYLELEFPHFRGPRLPIAACFVDSGYHASEVYAYTKQRAAQRVFACKGSSIFGHVPLAKKRRVDRANVWLFVVGVSQIKKTIYERLRLETPGPRFMHFTHAHNTNEYFAQLTCEVLKKEYRHGFPVRFWKKPDGARNEALDLRVYAYAAFLSLSELPAKLLERESQRLHEEARKLAEQRRLKSDPNQLPLLPEVAASIDPAPASPLSPLAVILGVPSGDAKDPGTAPSSEPPKVLETPLVDPPRSEGQRTRIVRRW
jgi:phage terminase large subunit GpA-like protein